MNPSSRRLGPAIIVAASLLLCAHATFATTVVAPTFNTLVQRADLIFTGRALKQRAAWSDTDGRRSIVTIISFEVIKTHKGEAAKTIDLQFLGGTIGDVTLEVDSIPQFTPGERVVLFVEQNGINMSPLIGLYHGKFSLRGSADPDAVVLNHRGDEVMDIEEVGRRKQARRAGQPARGPLTHAEFSAKIAEAVARNRN